MPAAEKQVWRSEDVRPGVRAERLAWHPAAAAEPPATDLPALLAEAWGEGPSAAGTADAAGAGGA